MKKGMKFNLSMNVDNEAFQPTPYPEIASILRAIAARIAEVTKDGRLSQGGWIGHYQTIFDANGNDIGRYAVKPDDYR